MPFVGSKLPGVLLDDSACDNSTNTTDNNPLEASDTTPHHNKIPCDHPLSSTLDILGGDSSATSVTNQHLSDDQDIPEAGSVDLVTKDHTVKPLNETLDRTISPQDTDRTSSQATENHNAAQTPNTRVRNQVRRLSGSPDIPNNARRRFFKIRYVPGKLEVSKTPYLTVSQRAERKKTMLNRMTGDQAKSWHKGRNSNLTAEKLRGRYS